MEVNSNIINTVFRDSEYKILWRDIMKYAVAIDYSHYLDYERETKHSMNNKRTNTGGVSKNLPPIGF